MKKLATISISVILILLSAQAAFAKGSIDLSMGFNKAMVNFVDEDFRSNEEGLKLGLSGKYYFTDKFSVASETEVAFVSWMDNYGYSYDYVNIDSDLFGRYAIIKSDYIDCSLQIGIKNSLRIASPENILEYTKLLNNFMLAVGAYIEISPNSKLDIYADLKLPIGVWGGSVNYPGYTENAGFFKIFLYDLNIGATYEINRNSFVGLEFNIDTAMYDGIHSALNNKYGFHNDCINFSIKTKVGYKF